MVGPRVILITLIVHPQIKYTTRSLVVAVSEREKETAGMASIGKRLSELTTPAFLVDRTKAKANCSTMLATCRDLGLTLRAQTKTHKTV